MLLRPNQTKFRKQQKGRLKFFETRSNKLKFGSFGLKCLSPGRITARQIEATRQAVVRRLRRRGKLWIRIYPDSPVTKKPNEIRMGKGKGSVDFWVAKVAIGQILFELEGIPQHLAFEALKGGANKLPVKTVFIKY
jgi:large subunit ribosomal protein L16